MNIKIFPAVPDNDLTHFVLFTSLNHPDWGLLYDSISTLKERFPDKVFSEPPMVYKNLEGKNRGLIFVERNSDELYYVY